MKSKSLALVFLWTSSSVAQAQIQPVAIPYLQVRVSADTYVALTPDHAAMLPKTIISQPCVRYNNFWCLKGLHWNGQTGVGEQHLAVFATPVYAARAFAIMIKKYYMVYNLKTPRTILGRFILSPVCTTEHTSPVCRDMWARVSKYSTDLSAAMGIADDEDCTLLRADGSFNAARARVLFKALAHQESGITLQVSDALIDEGIKAAGISMH